LTGPTASGKTAVGLELAGLLDAEIISLDSMTIYRDMDIGTAKPTAEHQAAVPHHLIDVVDPTEEYSLSAYVDAAQVKIGEVRGRGREVLFVGGTPLYLKALLRGIFAGPPADWEFRRQVQQEVREVGTLALHERLRQVDPLSAARLHPNDVRRIVRALEVHRLTGQPISHLQLQFDERSEADRVFVLDWPRARLRQRIEQRVESMFSHGLVEEVQGLLAKYGQLGRTARQAVGYRETLALLQGQYEQPEAARRIESRTNQFVRRQWTWFRSLSECRLVPLLQPGDPASIARQIVAQVT
jgi:tRNA dimethylallyltransferase